ncbi:MAG TPA: hypothetical protein VG297_03130 [Bryobacteraceae bacterium]|jgi:hypothetical protein|nr:hypothetical protein [Bryobacteraceae bacterium]
MFYFSLDIGKSHDPAAIVIVERVDHITLRYAARVPLGRPYPRLVERVRRLVIHDKLRA